MQFPRWLLTSSLSQYTKLCEIISQAISLSQCQWSHKSFYGTYFSVFLTTPNTCDLCLDADSQCIETHTYRPIHKVSKQKNRPLLCVCRIHQSFSPVSSNYRIIWTPQVAYTHTHTYLLMPAITYCEYKKKRWSVAKQHLSTT